MAQKWKLKVGIPIRFSFILVFHLKNGTLLLKIASYTYITNTKQQSIHRNTVIKTDTLQQIYFTANIFHSKHKYNFFNQNIAKAACALHKKKLWTRNFRPPNKCGQNIFLLQRETAANNRINHPSKIRILYLFLLRIYYEYY